MCYFLALFLICRCNLLAPFDAFLRALLSLDLRSNYLYIPSTQVSRRELTSSSPILSSYFEYLASMNFPFCGQFAAGSPFHRGSSSRISALWDFDQITWSREFADWHCLTNHYFFPCWNSSGQIWFTSFLWSFVFLIWYPVVFGLFCSQLKPCFSFFM